MVKEANPRMQTLVTTSAEAARNYSAQRLIDVWVPIINDLSLKKRLKPDPDKSSDFCEQKSLCAPRVGSDQRSLYDFYSGTTTGRGRCIRTFVGYVSCAARSV